jgi:DNA-binding LacI/PurR family transcriptional regulator
MPQRQAAKVLGVSQRTISNDCSESEQKALSPEALASIKDRLAENRYRAPSGGQALAESIWR